jgi:MFS family permease
MFRSLEHRNARLFFLGLSISNVGTWIQMTAVSLLVYQRTGKATDVGISLFCQFLPMLALGVWAGAVSDRVDKRRMTFVTQTGQAILAILLGVLALAGWATLPVIYAVSFANGVVGAVDNPARRGFVIELVEPRHISNVIALNTAVMTGSRIFGPALAALLVRWIEPGWLFILNGASFAAILWPIWFTDTSKLYPSPQAAAGGRPVREALSFVRRNRRLLVVFLVFTVVGTFAFNYNVSLLKLADRRFDDRALFGWLLAVTSVGSLAGSLLTAARDRCGSSARQSCSASAGWVSPGRRRSGSRTSCRSRSVPAAQRSSPRSTPSRKWRVRPTCAAACSLSARWLFSARHRSVRRSPVGWPITSAPSGVSATGAS